MAIDFMQLLNDPNIIRGIGEAGSALSRGEPFGVALDPSQMIRRMQSQEATKQLLAQILGGEQPSGQNLTNTGITGITAYDSKAGKPVTLTPTPQGQAGPDSIVETTKRTADGTTTTTTVKEPSQRNLDTFGTSVPLEAQPQQSTQTGKDMSPFFQALFG